MAVSMPADNLSFWPGKFVCLCVLARACVRPCANHIGGRRYEGVGGRRGEREGGGRESTRGRRYEVKEGDSSRLHLFFFAQPRLAGKHQGP